MRGITTIRRVCIYKFNPVVFGIEWHFSTENGKPFAGWPFRPVVNIFFEGFSRKPARGAVLPRGGVSMPGGCIHPPRAGSLVVGKRRRRPVVQRVMFFVCICDLLPLIATADGFRVCRSIPLNAMQSRNNDDFTKAIREHTKGYPAWQVFTFAEFVAIRKQWQHENGAACVIHPRGTNRAKYGTK